MARLLAFMLAMSFSAPLITPLLSAEPQSPLPACCRRDGKHACSMMKTARSSAASGPQFQALKMACADYPGGHTLPAAERLQLVLQPVGWSAPSANHILAAVELRTAYRGVIGRATHERGPPFTLQSL